MPASLFKDIGTIFEADAMAMHRLHKNARSDPNELHNALECISKCPQQSFKEYAPLRRFEASLLRWLMKQVSRGDEDAMDVPKKLLKALEFIGKWSVQVEKENLSQTA